MHNNYHPTPSSPPQPPNSQLTLLPLPLPNIRDPRAERDLPRRDVLRHERDLRLALVPRRARGPDLPDVRLERVARLDGRGEAHPEEAERGRVPAPDGGDDRARGEAEGGEPVQDHAPEACRLADRWVCRTREVSTFMWEG